LSEEAEKKKPGSPGRYSLADDGDAVPSTRIDSTTRMPAVRPEQAAAAIAAKAAAPPASVKSPVAPPRPPGKGNEKKNKTPPPPAKTPQGPKGAPAAPAPKAGPPSSRLFSAGPAGPAGAAKPDAGAKGAEPKAADAKALEKKPESKRSIDAKPDSKAAEAPKSTESAKEAQPESRLSRPPPRPPSIAPGPSRPVSSLRPPPPAKTPSNEPPVNTNDDALFSLGDFDEGSIAFAFDALVSEDQPNQPGTHEFDLAPVRELFSELAANHMRHVRDFMIDVKWGEVTRDWINICVPPVRTLRKAATHLDLVELGEALEKVGQELDAANAVGGQLLDADEKKRLLDAYEELVKILPQAFALDRDKTQREAVIVQALLLQVPDVRKVTIDKLHAAGLTSLTVLFDANAGDVAHVAGIQLSLAERIVERVQAYRAELQSSSPQDARAAEREKLAGLNGQLAQHHVAYEEAANAWGPEAKAKKRDHFRAREEKWLEISVLLARFGEVDRLQGIEKVPFSQRITQLSDYIEEARDKYRSPEG
jgi:hypothetical protein